MAEVAAAAVAYLTEGEVILTAAEAAATFAAVSTAVSLAYSSYSRGRAERKARDAYNASLRDRYIMGRSATEPRALILGRQRVSGSPAFLRSYGPSKGKLVVVLPIAAHEVDAFEEHYFDDEPVVLDVDGYVIGIRRREYFSIAAPSAAFTLESLPKSGSVSAEVAYGSTVVALGVSVAGSTVTVSGASSTQVGTVTISYQPDPCPFVVTSSISDVATITTDGTGAGSVTLPHTPISSSATVGYGTDFTTVSLTVVGNVVSVSGLAAGAVVTVNYQYSTGTSRARITTFSGGPGQVADPALITAFPGIWTSAHVGNSIAWIKYEFDYDPDAFPSNFPNPSVRVRGAKLYDPRTGLTAFSENPALQMRFAALHPLCGRLPVTSINDNDVIVAANVCDETVTYVVNGQSYTRPRYTAGLLVKNGTQGKDVLDDLAQAMGAGDWWFSDGMLRMKAGAWVTPLQTLTEDWLKGPGVKLQPRLSQQQKINIATGTFADETHDYQELPYPQVRSSEYIAADGRELPRDIPLNAVTFAGQAQQVVATMMRKLRFGRRLTVMCTMRAWQVEVGDNIWVNLSRFGYVNVPFEVLDTSFTIDGGIQLVLKQTSSTIWDLGTGFVASTRPPNARLPSPFDLSQITGLAVASDATVQSSNADGTVVQRMRVSFDAPTSASALAPGGGVEVRYGQGNWSEEKWISVRAIGGQTQIDIGGVQQGQIYLVKARAYNALLNGQWSDPVLHRINEQAISIGTPQLATDAVNEEVILTSTSYYYSTIT